MAIHERFLGHGVLFLVLAVVVPPAVNWLRTCSALPPGYGAAGDRRWAYPLPAPVRVTVEEQSEGADGTWVKERVEGGSWVYELHVLKEGQSSVIRIDPHGAADVVNE